MVDIQGTKEITENSEASATVSYIRSTVKKVKEMKRTDMLLTFVWGRDKTRIYVTKCT